MNTDALVLALADMTDEQARAVLNRIHSAATAVRAARTALTDGATDDATDA